MVENPSADGLLAAVSHLPMLVIVILEPSFTILSVPASRISLATLYSKLLTNTALVPIPTAVPAVPTNMVFSEGTS